MSFDRSQTVTVADADLIDQIGAHGRAIYLEGADLRRARRLVKVGLLAPGRLGDRYFDLSERGNAFVRGRQEHRSA